ncbi:tyrosine-type recombinase/integrase [Meridianimarinicoccus marinus]
MAKALPPPMKEYPTIDEAEDMISSMPGVTRLQRRNKAIVACAFLTGLRAAALLSMKLKHLDTEARMAVQDGREMHAKNGKSFTVRWFPMPESFAHCVVAWKEEISALGFGPDDALFPAGKYLTAPLGDHENIPILLTTDPITRAFQQACSGTGNHYTPHAARHCLKALGDRICTTSKALKAWSLNLGHDSLVTTETYYGKMTETDRMRILGDLTAQQGSSDDEKDLMLRYCLHELAPGTPEFKRAKALIRRREEEMESAAVVE